MIPKHIIDQIRNEASANIVDIISEHVELKKSGSSMKGRCPFHDENTPSFSVSEGKGIYKCFGCGESGDAVNFLIEYTGHSFIEVITELAARFHITIPDDPDYKPQDPNTPTVHNALSGYQKADIRKSGYAFLVFNTSDLEKIEINEGDPVMLTSFPIKELEAKALVKCTSNLVLKADSALMGTDNFWKTLQTILSIPVKYNGAISVFIQPVSQVPSAHKQSFSGSLDFGQLKDWLTHAIHHLQPNEWLRKNLVVTIAAIPDKITRTVYKSHFFELWEQKLKATN